MTREEIYKELKKVLREFESMNYDTAELYEMLCKIKDNWKAITKEQ